MNKQMRCVTHGDLKYYTCNTLPIRHAFTCKAGGVSTGFLSSLNLGFQRGDSREHVLKNYHILADALQIPFDKITMTQQVHEDKVMVVTSALAGTGLTKPMDWRADAIVTNIPNVPLIGFSADCVVTLLYDPVSQAIGVCHAGWRGTAAGILGKAVHTMAVSFGTKAQHVRAVIGPSIHACCFETDADVPQAMQHTFGAAAQQYVTPQGAKYFVDLQGLNALSLLQEGVLLENITDSDICTKCNAEQFWSHRVTGDKRGVQAAVICL